MVPNPNGVSCLHFYCVAYLIESLEAIWDSYPDDYNPDLLKG